MLKIFFTQEITLFHERKLHLTYLHSSTQKISFKISCCQFLLYIKKTRFCGEKQKKIIQHRNHKGLRVLLTSFSPKRRKQLLRQNRRKQESKPNKLVDFIFCMYCTTFYILYIYLLFWNFGIYHRPPQHSRKIKKFDCLEITQEILLKIHIFLSAMMKGKEKYPENVKSFGRIFHKPSFPMEQPTFRQLFLYEPNKSYCLRISQFSSGIFHINFILQILFHSFFLSSFIRLSIVPFKGILFCDITFKNQNMCQGMESQ